MSNDEYAVYGEDGLNDPVRDVYEQLLSRAPENKVEPRLEPVMSVLDMLGSPQNNYPVIHITGTNGKTSTARILEAGLRASGLRTGRFTSPHLSKVTERISVDGVSVHDSVFARQWEELKPYLEIADQQLRNNSEFPLTFFEALTVLAFAIFADAPVDVLVLEVGLGGITDATNVVDAVVAVFTPISLDHTDLLGGTVENIAAEKIGIIKPDSYVISALQQHSVNDLIADKARGLKVPAVWEGRDFMILDRQIAVGGQVVGIQGLAGTYQDVLLPLHGAHQAQNFAVALAALEAFIGAAAKPLGQEVIDSMVQNISSPGRLEIVHKEPTVIVDAAHNPAGALVTAQALVEAFDFSGVIVLAVLDGKDARGIIQTFQDVLGDRISSWCFTQSSSSRAVAAADLAQDALAWGVPEVLVHAEENLELAVRWAEDEARRYEEGSGLQRSVLVAGSITAVAQARAMYGLDRRNQRYGYQDLTVRDALETPSVSERTAKVLGLDPDDDAE